MFKRIFVEDSVSDHPRTKKILNFFNQDHQTIDKVETYFNRVKKPYLQKRDNLNLFIGKKEFPTIKEAPLAYGVAGDLHYYFIHAYNCIYECDYCYLQGHFNSPDIVLFVNYDDIAKEMRNLCENNKDKTVWFHAGEFSDSLALSHITGEISYYFDIFKDLPNAKLELRTKSANIRELEKVSPLKNVITSFSLSPAEKIKSHDLKTPSLKHRLISIKKLSDLGHPIGIHFDPVIYDDDFEQTYEELADSLVESLDEKNLQYLSIGVVRFTKDVYHQVKNNYPQSSFFAQDFIKSENNLVRYNYPMRKWMLNKIKSILLSRNISEEKIYFCMETI